MTSFPIRTANRLCLAAALLIVAAPLLAQSEPLGDVARQLRSERQKSGVHPKVWTNEDLGAPAGGDTSAEPQRALKDGQAQAGAQGEDEAAGTGAGKKPGAEKEAKKTGDNAAATDHAASKDKNSEFEKRTQEISAPYLDRIAAVHQQMEAAQKELTRLQRDQIESSNQFRGSSGTSVSIYEFQAQQQGLQQQIATQQKLIQELSGQLDDAREAARHAGVPHATDY